MGSLIDCSYVAVDDFAVELQDGARTIGVSGVGFLVFETLDGNCYWEMEIFTDGNFEIAGSELDIYWRILGDFWTRGRILTLSCAAFAWFLFLYSFSFYCTSQVRCCRYLNGTLLAVVLSVCQASTFVVYGSSFCQRRGCYFSRGSGLSVSAIACYVIAGIGYFLSRDYPGEKASTVSGGGEIADSDDVENKPYEAAPDASNASAVYASDPELTPSEQAEAKEISARLGGTVDSGAPTADPGGSNAAEDSAPAGPSE